LALGFCIAEAGNDLALGNYRAKGQRLRANCRAAGALILR
jgi:hypothetical protein